MSVPKYTTPTITLTFTEQDLDFTSAQEVYVTFTSGNYELTKTGEDLTLGEKTIGIHLTQAETGNFNTSSVLVQANWITGNNDRCASEVNNIEMSKQLLKKVI